MKVFILGLNKSGRTTVAKALAEESSFYYVSAIDWLKTTFRQPYKQESLNEFQADFLKYTINRVKLNPSIISDNIKDIIHINNEKKIFIIDDILNPNDLVSLFDFKNDIIVFLNRIDNMTNAKDYEGISINVMRDYCLWLATVGLLDKEQWLEYNFKIPGEESEFTKTIGTKNTITITKCINRAIKDIKDRLCKLNQTVP